MPSRSSRSRPASRPRGASRPALLLSRWPSGGTLATGRAVRRGVYGSGRCRLCRRRFQPQPSRETRRSSRGGRASRRRRARRRARPRRRSAGETPNAVGRLVVAGEVGVEHRRVVGRDRAADAGGDELRQRVLGERRRRRPVRRFESGQTSRTVPRPASSAHEPGVLLRRGCRAGSGRRRAPRARRAPTAAPRPRPRAAPSRGPSDRASVKAGSYGSGGYSASSPPSPTATTPRSRYFAEYADDLARPPPA